jgi:hypothetical protein
LISHLVNLRYFVFERGRSLAKFVLKQRQFLHYLLGHLLVNLFEQGQALVEHFVGAFSVLLQAEVAIFE